jgi:hypothetical protein
MTLEALARSDEHLAAQAERQRESEKKFDDIQQQIFKFNAEHATMVIFNLDLIAQD